MDLMTRSAILSPIPESMDLMTRSAILSQILRISTICMPDSLSSFQRLFSRHLWPYRSLGFVLKMKCPESYKQQENKCWNLSILVKLPENLFKSNTHFSFRKATGPPKNLVDLNSLEKTLTKTYLFTKIHPLLEAIQYIYSISTRSYLHIVYSISIQGHTYPM